MSLINFVTILFCLSFIVEIQTNVIDTPVPLNIICYAHLNNLEPILGSIFIVPLNCPTGTQFVNGNCHIIY